MLIESRIKPVPPKTVRTITLFGTPYEFKPVIPGRFVANVTQQKHIDTFLSNPAYAEFKDEIPSATLQRSAPAQPPAPVAPAPIAPAGPVVPKDELPEGDDTQGEDDGDDDAEGGEGDEDLAAGGATDDPGEWPTAIADEAATLLRNAPAKLAVAIGKVTDIKVLHCALALEKNRSGRQTPRQAVVELLEGTLRDIAAAG